MTIDEIITLIKQRTKRTADTSAEALILQELKSAQRDLERAAFLPWFLVSNYFEYTAGPDTEAIGLPTDFNRELDEDALWYYDATADDPWVPLEKEDYDFIKEEFPDPATQPQAYALVGLYFRVRPIPTLSTTYRMLYLLKDTEPALATTNRWSTHAPDVLLNLAASRYAKWHLRDKEAAEAFKEEYAVALRELQRVDRAREDANRELVMGEP